jgi:hypothetical protein
MNAAFNAIFLLQIAKVSDSELIAQSMVVWGGFFVAGSCVAPFENYFLYRRLNGSDQYSKVTVLQLSSSLFTLVGVSISLSQSVTLWILLPTLLIGFCVGQVVYLRSEAIYQEELTKVSISNTIEGLFRVTFLMVFTTQFERITLWHVLISYAAGNIASVLPYLKLKNLNQTKTHSTLPVKKIYGFAAIGFLSALITGGLAYMAGFFEIMAISTILFFFTISRSLLIFQSALVYVKPQWALNLGGETSIAKLIKYSLASLFPIFLLLTLAKLGLELVLDIDLSLIKNADICFFSFALITSALFNLKVASQNATNQWISVLTAAILGFLTACLAFVVVEPAANSFYAAMIFAPLIGIVFLIKLTKKREYGIDSK